jgi:hypothetical protein
MWMLREGATELVDISPTFDWTAADGFELPDLGAGDWPNLFPAPDGQWVLAQHSGECEVPHAFFVKRNGDDLHAATGQDGTALDRLSESIAYGWVDSHTAVVELTQGACGNGTRKAGIHFVSPHGKPELLVPYNDDVSPSVAVFFRFDPDAPEPPSDTAPTTLEAARAKWAAVNAQNYSFDYSQTCFCPYGPEPIRITVRNGRVTDIGGTPENGRTYPTIDDLFDRVAEFNDLAHRSGGSAITEYDVETGAPLSLDSDPMPMAVDDEMKFAVTNLTIEE